MAMGPRQAELLSAMMLDEYERMGTYKQNQIALLHDLENLSIGIKALYDWINGDVNQSLSWANTEVVILIETMRESMKDIATMLILMIGMETNVPMNLTINKQPVGPAPGTVTYENPPHAQTAPQHVNFGNEPNFG